MATSENIDVCLMTQPADSSITTMPASGNWFIRHWRGEISLGESYWLNGVLLANCLPRLIVFGYEATQPFSHSLRLGAAAALVITAFQVAIVIWATVASYAPPTDTPRAADRYSGPTQPECWSSSASS